MRTSNVPLATIKPSDLDDSLPSSSRRSSQPNQKPPTKSPHGLTSHSLLDIIQHQIHKLIVALKCTNHYRQEKQKSAKTPNSSINSLQQNQKPIPSLPPLNLTVISLSIYLARSRIFSFLGLSLSWCCPPWPPPPLPPPRPPRWPESPPPPPPPRPPPRPPRKCPRSDMIKAQTEIGWAVVGFSETVEYHFL